MHRPALLGLALGVGLLVTLVSVVSACGGNERQEEAPKPQLFPEWEQALRPGPYRSEDFEPSLTFRVGEGWSPAPPELSDILVIVRGEVGALGFANAQEVYEPPKTALPAAVEAPDDMVGWFQRHPLLRTSLPEPVTVGGAEGERFDVVVGELPDDYVGICGRDCVATIRFSDGTRVAHRKGGKWRVIVLEEVESETVEVVFGSRAADFDEFAPEAQKVVDTVEWESGS